MSDPIEDGRRIKAILADRDFQSIVETVEEEIIEEWKTAGTVEERERAHALQTALERIIAHMDNVAGRGEYEKLRSTKNERN